MLLLTLKKVFPRCSEKFGVIFLGFFFLRSILSFKRESTNASDMTSVASLPFPFSLYPLIRGRLASATASQVHFCICSGESKHNQLKPLLGNVNSLLQCFLL